MERESAKDAPMEAQNAISSVPEQRPAPGKGKRPFKRNKGKRASHTEAHEISGNINARLGSRGGPNTSRIDCGTQTRTTLLPITLFGVMLVLRKYMVKMQLLANKPLAQFWMRPPHVVEASTIRVARMLCAAASVKVFNCLLRSNNPGDLPKLYRQQTIDRLKRSFSIVPKPVAAALAQIGHININSAQVTPTFGMFDLNNLQDPNEFRRVGSLNFCDLVAWLNSGQGFVVTRDLADELAVYFSPLAGFTVEWNEGVLMPTQATIDNWGHELNGDDFDTWELFVDAHKDDEKVTLDLLELKGGMSQAVRLREYTEYAKAYANIALGDEAAVLSGAVPLGYERLLKKQCYLQSKIWFGARQWTIPTEDCLNSLMRPT
jgi:hypothetical protein